MTVGVALVALLFGFLGYREASSFAARTGRAPWGWPPLVWGLCTAASLFLGGVLLMIARRSSGPVAAPPLPGPPHSDGPTLTRTILPGR